ncbi:Luciferin 4-monooxygenase [Cyphomyrmex costatus]|uniref:Luciferin 4-monooxygenase n=1 Tax=Cyphomyrmex costatus TaxID=456900 RepID=A0A151I8I4_9HYME|nr:Luciferin 4-monooxygenase [Cyphomyrmex costatus]
MRENSVKCALWLQQLQCKNTIITICTRHKTLEYIPFLASLYVGATVNTWNEKYMDDRIRIMYFLTEYVPSIIFIDSENYNQFKSVINFVNFDKRTIKPPKIITFGKIKGVDSLESILNDVYDKIKIDEFSCVKMRPMDTVAITFSPSATSYPDSKVYLRCFAFIYPSNQEVPVMNSGDIGLWYGSLNWSYSVILTVRSIISYVTVVKCPQFSDENLYETIEKYKVSWIFLESKICTEMFYTDIGMHDVSSLKQLVIDDSDINLITTQQKLELKFINASIVQVYSIAEPCIIAAYQRNNQRRFGSSGYVAKNVQLMVRDIESKEIVRSNKSGTIWFKFIYKWCSPQTCKMQNYNNKWCCTGDYGYYEKDGEIYIIDKIKDLIKYRIYYLSSTKIENTLLQHPAVSEVVVRSVPHRINGQHPVAYVKTKFETEVTEVELIQFVANNLPDIYKLRGGVHFKRRMPYLPNGKIDRMLVASIYASKQSVLADFSTFSDSTTIVPKKYAGFDASTGCLEALYSCRAVPAEKLKNYLNVLNEEYSDVPPNLLIQNVQAQLIGEEEPIMQENVGDLILNAFKSDPNFIGQVNAETEEQLTFQQMRENSVKCALWLKKEGIKKGDVVAICTRNSSAVYAPFLASIYIGAIVNPWEEKHFEDIIRIMYFLIEHEPDIIFIDSDNMKHLKLAIELLNFEKRIITDLKIITFGRTEDVDSFESIMDNVYDKNKIDKFSCVKLKPMDIVAIMFSPSATNYPDSKVYIRCFAFTYPSNQEVPVMNSGDIGLWYGSLNWSYSVILTVRSIISYVTVVKCSQFSDENLYKTIEKYKVSWVFLESKMCTKMFYTDIRMYNISSLKQLIIDDSGINCSDTQEKLNEKFINVSIVQVYSIAESCIIAAFQRNNQLPGSSGYVAKNVQLLFYDMKSEEIINSCKTGTIWYKFLFKWCSPKTCKLQNFSQIWRCTGDYGYYERSGEIYIIDKIKDLIKYKIFYLSPTRIENTLLQHPAVSEVVVRSVPHSNNGQHPVAYVKKKFETQVTAVELIEFVANNLPDIYKLRGGLHFRRRMPYLPNGKIDRMQIEQIDSMS